MPRSKQLTKKADKLEAWIERESENFPRRNPIPAEVQELVRRLLQRGLTNNACINFAEKYMEEHGIAFVAVGKQFVARVRKEIEANDKT